MRLYILVSVMCHQVVAVLSRQDLVEIREIIAEAINPLREEIRAMKSDIREMKGDIIEGFRGVHNLGRDRVEVAIKVTRKLSMKNFNCTGSLTRHAFKFNGYVGELMTPHTNCDGANASQLNDRNNLIFLHPTKDLGIISQCPSTEAVLDISVSTIPKLGDNVVAFGFGDTAEVWTGPMSKIIPTKDDVLMNHWTGTGNIITSGEYLVQSAQHHGMSGAATSNGCGYLGMAHAVNIADMGLGVFASIIPAKDIQAFILNITVKNSRALKRYDECLRSDNQLPLDIITFPIFPFMNCSLEDNFICNKDSG